MKLQIGLYKFEEFNDVLLILTQKLNNLPLFKDETDGKVKVPVCFVIELLHLNDTSPIFVFVESKHNGCDKIPLYNKSTRLRTRLLIDVIFSVSVPNV